MRGIYDNDLEELRKAHKELVEKWNVEHKEEKIMSDIHVCEPDHLAEAKKLIVDFVSKEYGSKDPEHLAGIFNDLKNIPLAYTLFDNPLDPNASGNDNDHEIQVSVDLINYILKKSVDGITVNKMCYGTIDGLIEHLLKYLDFDELVSLDDSDWKRYNVVIKKFEEKKPIFEDRIEQLTPNQFIDVLLHDKEDDLLGIYSLNSHTMIKPYGLEVGALKRYLDGYYQCIFFRVVKAKKKGNK